jgi:hypothetical protein
MMLDYIYEAIRLSQINKKNYLRRFIESIRVNKLRKQLKHNIDEKYTEVDIMILLTDLISAVSMSYFNGNIGWLEKIKPEYTYVIKDRITTEMTTGDMRPIDIIEFIILTYNDEYTYKLTGTFMARPFKSANSSNIPREAVIYNDMNTIHYHLVISKAKGIERGYTFEIKSIENDDTHSNKPIIHGSGASDAIIRLTDTIIRQNAFSMIEHIKDYIIDIDINGQGKEE